MIWITGDTHGEIDISKLTKKNWPESNNLTKSDYLIIVGDFGFLWLDLPDETEQKWLKWFSEQKWTTLFIDGNHENHNRLDALEKVEMFGNLVGKVNDSVFHLRRGNIYTIDKAIFFCFGGAFSNDFDLRVNQIDWWPQEIPSESEFQFGLNNLEKNNFKIDYFLFHTIPESIQDLLQSPKFNSVDPTCKMLEEFITKTIYKCGFSGHFHIDIDFPKWSILFDRVINLK
jgi:predicted phosphodiesterase